MRLKISNLSKRKKKSVVANLDRLSNKYGIDCVRLIANHYFSQVRARKNLEKAVAIKERELNIMKAKLA